MRTLVEPPAALKEAAAEWIARRDAGLSPTEQEQFETWLGADPQHRAALDWYDGPWAALDRPARAGVADEVLEHLQVLDRRQRRRRLASAAAGVAVLLAGVAFWQFSFRTMREGINPGVTARLVLPAHRVLPDGTTVDLKDGAEIAVDYTVTARRVTLRHGEAHFQVARDPAKPFVVAASDIEFRAVGTAFSVQLGTKEVELLVTEGRVAVDKPAESLPAGPAPVAQGLAVGPQTIATVDAGNRLAVPRNHGAASIPTPTAVSEADISDRLAWRAPRMEFTGTPLVEAVGMLNRQRARQNVRLVIGDASIDHVKISGLFRADDTAALIELLEIGFGIKAERRGDSEIVLHRAD